MRALRLALGSVGVAGILWGAWLLSDDGTDRLRSTGLWLVGIVVVHDAVLAPVVVVLGYVAARALPRHRRAVVAIAFLVWGTLTIAVANVLSGVGGKPGMDSLLHRPYVAAWLMLSGVLVVVALVFGSIMRRERRTTDA